jgi:HlyD family secretion protein
MRGMSLKVVVLALVLLAAAGGAGAWYWMKKNPPAAGFRTAAVTRGELVSTISATGTIEPEEVVDVGAQVAGQVLSFGKDKNGKEIDYRSSVEAGDVLATIDSTLYASKVTLAEAGLQQAKASQMRAEADLLQFDAKLEQAESDWARAQKLGPEAIAATSYDAFKAAQKIAKANVATGKAAIEQAKAAVAMADANLKDAEKNLSYCIIKSPVKGVIIDRRVNIGQTVVSSLNAPSLFLIAKDLTQMEIWVSVNEADVGSIHQGQPVTFTVDAFPGRVFKGEVDKVRYNATMTQNVVTYTTEVKTSNKDGTLMPYQTANVLFEIGRSKADALLVPDAALRWTPQPQQIDPESAPAAGDGKRRRDKAKPDSAKADAPAADGVQGRGTVWVVSGPQGQYVRAVPVKTGISDRTNTEIQEGDGALAEGTEVVIGAQRRQDGAAPAASKSPFTPQMPSRGRGSSASKSEGKSGEGKQ